MHTWDLWLPILVSGVFVFIVSSVVHMVLPIHQSDQKKVPNEDDVLAALRQHGVGPGEYMLPRPDSVKEMSKPEVIAKYDQGPVGWLIVAPNGMPNIGKSLLQWFVFTLVVGVFVAYLGTLALERGAGFTAVFQFTGAAATLGYAFSNVTNSIWKSCSWVSTAKFVFDGVLYGLTTGATFAWLWPSAAV